LRYVKPDKSRITFNELAKQYKRIHDQNGGGYPFEVTLIEESTEQPLLRKGFQNGMDRRGETENICESDFDFPLAIKFQRWVNYIHRRRDGD